MIDALAEGKRDRFGTDSQKPIGSCRAVLASGAVKEADGCTSHRL